MSTGSSFAHFIFMGVVTRWSFDPEQFRQKHFDFRRCFKLFLVAICMVYDNSEPQKIKFNDGE